ncbi:hypothetical protein H4582DRAFT_1941910 [Lactarius indigo]|nr:hypothetical protein H4582DRAFT_1941910 [Lactarius indigo]
MVKQFREWYQNKAKSLSEDIRRTLVRTRLNDDQELEKFIDRIPSLCGSMALATRDNGDPDAPSAIVLLLSTIQLVWRAFTSRLPKSALYRIPGAKCSLLALYPAGEHHFSKILPLLDSLETINELWDTPKDDVTLSVRCAAAAVAAFMITPTRRVLDNFLIPNVFFIWDYNTGKQFLDKRLRVGAGADNGVAPEFHLRSISARMQDLERFLTDAKYTLRCMNAQWWAFENVDSIRRKRRKLFTTRHTEEYRAGRGTFDQPGDRGFPAFVHATHQDLITLTLGIPTRDPNADAAKSQRGTFRDGWMESVHVESTQARNRRWNGHWCECEYSTV